MPLYKTSFSPTMVTMTNTASQVLAANPRRRAIILSGGNDLFSVSFSPGLVLERAMLNFQPNQALIAILTAHDLGSAITQPMYGISDSGGATVEILEVMCDEKTGPDY